MVSQIVLAMSSIPRVVPWTSPQEYQNVYQWLYSDSPELRELGVKRVFEILKFFDFISSTFNNFFFFKKNYSTFKKVKAWSSRGKIPQSIVFTAAFVEASLRDEFAFGKISNHELRLLYSMAFIRYCQKSHSMIGLDRIKISFKSMEQNL